MISRNDPCWCNSGKKYKSCHLRMDEKLEALYLQGYEIPDHDLILSDEHISGVMKSAEITKGIFDHLEGKIVAGMTTQEIDDMVHAYTISKGGVPATLGYNGYTKSCCTSVNDVVCHGIPGERVLVDGDIVNVDITTNLNGYFSDSSRMYLIGEVTEAAKRLVDETYECMMVGIRAVKPYESVDVIGEAVEAYANSKGYFVVRDLGGHGIGLNFHEEPHINHFRNDDMGMIMTPGMMFTIEPMIAEKSHKVITLEDGWTVMTKEGGLSAQWEHTILVTEEGAKIIT